MKSLRINIVLPFLTTRPNGGVKIMYEYANRLHQRGHVVTVLHSIQRPYRKIKSPVWWKQLNYRLRGLSRPPWFPLHANITSLVVPEITDRYVPVADITLCTWWEMTWMISKLSDSSGHKFNLVQGYETWAGHESLVHESYRLVNNIVIAAYLQQLVARYSDTAPVHIPNAIDTERFRLQTPIEARSPQSIIMLYSEEPHKGTTIGIEALTQLKSKYPELKVQLFGVYAQPSLPNWMEYAHKPADLCGLMNRHAIFCTPSLVEGWALPPAEAMACGCAVVCTDIGGHADYAKHEQTALLCIPKNAEDLAEKLSRLIEDDALRKRIAAEGHQFITTQFSWDHSLDLLEECFAAAL